MVKLDTPKQQELKDLALKMKLEIPMKADIKSFLRRFYDDFAVIYTRTGKVLDLSVYDSELQAVLKKNYKRVQMAFKRNLRNQLKNNKQDESDINDEVEAALLLWLLMQAKKQSEFIISTTGAAIQEEVQAVIRAAGQDGIVLTNKEIAAAVKAELKKKAEGRAEIIAITEVQQVAEATKQIEAVAVENTILLPVPLLKEWRAVLDERTRNTHFVADGQVRLLTVPFDVGGQKLMFPGDTSLGASVGNIINCRCVSIKKIGA